MTHQYLKPVAMAISVALALTACGKQESATTAATGTSTMAPATASTVAAAENDQSIFDVSELGAPSEACTDFNLFVNAKWVATNPIPSDRARWGAFDKLADDSLNTQHTIVENAAEGVDKATAGSIEQEIGYLYKSGMDDAAIDKAGFNPIKHKLAEIDQLKNGKDVANYLDNSFAQGDMQVFQFGANADFKHAETQIG
jgi:putative endopeptidase